MQAQSFNLSEMEEVIKTVLASGGEFSFFPKGTSMLPLIRQDLDSVVLISLPENVGKYDIPLYKRDNGQYVIHRVVGVTDAGFTMCGDNQTVKEYGIRREQMIGLVSAVCHDGKRKDLYGNTVYSIYCRIWCVMFIRRSVFFVRRCLSKLKRLIFK